MICNPPSLTSEASTFPPHSPLITFVIKFLLSALLLSCLSTYAADETVKPAQPAEANSVVWPTKPPSQIYILPVTIEPAAIADAKKKNA